MAARAPDFKPGDLLPGTKYRVVKELGAGGMGVVYQVVKPPQIQGVLKLMGSDLTQHEEFRTRFFDEVRVLAQLDHPNIVKVFDYDSLTDGTPYYVMELLHGRTVRDVLATMGTLPPRVAFEVTRQLCEALHCAHTHDIPVVHRDIKPENIFLHAPRHGEPVVKLIDFGVVAVADRQDDGTFVGTWKYAAPEQIRGQRPTPQTDIYAVGLVLYEMLCGIGPFEAYDSGTLVSQAHLREIPAPVSKFAPWVPPSVVALIASALAKDPRQRPADAYAFAERLFELEWANDGKDPNDRTAEGPLSQALHTATAGRPSSQNVAAALPVPVIGDLPKDAKHDGPTLRGMGGGTGSHEPTSPGEDALLAGLGARPDLRSKKARDSGPRLEDRVVVRPKDGAVVAIEGTPLMPPVAPASRPGANVNAVSVPTLDAPPSDRGPRHDPAIVAALAAATAPGGARDATTLKKDRDAQSDTDTFASQESDARRQARSGGSKLVLPLALVAIAVIGAGSFAALRGRGGATTVATTTNTPAAAALAPSATPAPSAEPPVATTPPTSASPSASASPSTAASLAASTVATKSAAKSAKSATVAAKAAPPASAPAYPLGGMPAAAPAPKASKPDESFIRVLP